MLLNPGTKLIDAALNFVSNSAIATLYLQTATWFDGTVRSRIQRLSLYYLGCLVFTLKRDWRHSNADHWRGKYVCDVEQLRVDLLRLYGSKRSAEDYCVYQACMHVATLRELKEAVEGCKAENGCQDGALETELTTQYFSKLVLFDLLRSSGKFSARALSSFKQADKKISQKLRCAPSSAGCLLHSWTSVKPTLGHPPLLRRAIDI